jgi:spore germination cell wall hydrolase CwlJ-like protein
VVRNRVKRSGTDYCAVVFAPAQFSWTSFAQSRLVPTSGDAWPRALRISPAVVTGPKLPDLTGNSMHFYAPRVVHPTWARLASTFSASGSSLNPFALASVR